MIDSSSGIVYTIRAEGQTYDRVDYMVVPFNSVMVIGEPEIEIQLSNGRWKKLKKVDYKDIEIVTEHFHSDHWIRQIDLPQNSRFRVEINQTIGDIFLFPQILLASPYDVDTLSAVIEFPEGYTCLYRLWNLNEHVDIEIDTVYLPERNQISFRLKPEKIKPEYNFFRPVFRKLDRYPSLTTLILPASYRGEEDQYLNTWYNNLLVLLDDLSHESQQEIFDIVGNTKSQDSIIRILSNELKRSLKYLDVEVGMGSFRPSDPNETLYKLQGDCKDMAYLLCSSLRLFGIDARMAIASTWYNNTDLDFPVLTGGDHTICAINRGTVWQFIDLTEKYGNIEFPSRMIQNRHVYITGDSLGKIMRVDPVVADSNRVHWNITLKQGDDHLEGRFRLVLTGLAMTTFREAIAMSSKGSTIFMDEYLQIYSEKLLFDSLAMEDNYGKIIIRGYVRTKSQPVTYNQETFYLWKNFIPYPHPFTRNIQDQLHYNDHTILQTLNLRLDLNREFSSPSFPGYTHQTSFSDFKAQISKVGNNVLRYKYKFMMKELEFKGPDLYEYNMLNDTLKSYFSDVLVFK